MHWTGISERLRFQGPGRRVLTDPSVAMVYAEELDLETQQKKPSVGRRLHRCATTDPS
jgi:hypothetical protein